MSPGKGTLGGAGARFTMLLRVNQPKNVDDLARLQSTYGQLRSRDIFLIPEETGPPPEIEATQRYVREASKPRSWIDARPR